MNITNLEEKKNQLLERYRDLFIQNTGFTGNMLDNYVTNLIVLGEEQYGSNFTEDILKEKREDSILWLMDEVSKRGGMVAASSMQGVVKNTLQDTVNAFDAVANQKAQEEQANEKDKILELIGKMDEYQFEKYLSSLSWPNDTLAKFKGIVSYKISQNPDLSEFEVSKDVLKSMADEVELILPALQDEKSFASVPESVASVDDTFNGYVKVENAINNNEQLTKEQKEEWRDNLWKDFDNFVEQNSENDKEEETIDKEAESVIDSNEEKVEDVSNQVPKSTMTREELAAKLPPIEPVVISEPTEVIESINEQETEPIESITEQVTEPIVVGNDNVVKENEPIKTDIPTVIPATAKVGKRKEAPKTLKQKFKEKWKNASFKKKLLIGAVAVGAIIGVGVIAATAISNMIATQSFDSNSIMMANQVASNAINSLDLNSVSNAIDPNAVSVDSSVVDWNSIGQGTEVHTTLNEALTDTNTLTSNEWMNVDHMEAVNTAGDVINLDGMTVDQVNQTLDSGDYGVRGSSNGTYMGWFDEETVKDAINQGKVL